MAALTTYGILLRSSVSQEDGIEDDFAQSGTQHSRTFFSQSYFNFAIFEKVTLAQFTTMQAEYDATPRAAFTLTYFDVSPAVTYSVKYIAPPEIVDNLGGGKYVSTRRLRGTKV